MSEKLKHRPGGSVGRPGQRPKASVIDQKLIIYQTGHLEAALVVHVCTDSGYILDWFEFIKNTEKLQLLSRKH